MISARLFKLGAMPLLAAILGGTLIALLVHGQSAQATIESHGPFPHTVQMATATLSSTQSQETISTTTIYLPVLIDGEIVPPGNLPPVITNPGPQQGILQADVSRTIEAIDLDGDSFTYTATGLPTGLVIHALHGQILGTFEAVGTFTTTITVQDSQNNTTTITFTWDVLPYEPVELPAISGSVARLWNEVLLFAIRNDYARPTVHARNLFHSSFGMYDIWAIYDPVAETYLLGKERETSTCPLETTLLPQNSTAETRNAAREEAISYYMYRLIQHRFPHAPSSARIMDMTELAMAHLGYDPKVDTTDYTTGPAALGNYLASCVIAYGLQDGANEANGYANLFYTPVNEPLKPHEPGNPTMTDPNHWQQLALATFIDQAGNVISGTTPAFLSPEWGTVSPFALQADDRTVYTRDGHDYWVYHDPGAPPHLTGDANQLADEYKWGFALVAMWASHLDPTDGVMWDISPAAIGNISELPTTTVGLRDFYQQLAGGDSGQGRAMNPVTGKPYTPQVVPRGDYARVLAEFWADGPDSETPPGHWFTILNYVNDHPALDKRYQGEGEILDELEWDVKAYFVLGGAVHDAAIAAWGVKGWYDFIRPISAIRYMADRGQSTDPNLPHYHQDGIPLIAGYIELVSAADPLAGEVGEHVGKLKLFTWRGPDAISDPAKDTGGVGWILAEDWWPYQRPTFVTPPFAGYVSGHSTYSRAAAEVLTMLTGDPYFPGGMGEFHAEQNEFLIFEEGPSVDVTLQWATYRDASDQCSLSRIWGGIHPPVDDMPGRLIGKKVGIAAFEMADSYFNGHCIEDDRCPAR